MASDLELTLSQSRDATAQWLALLEPLTPARANWRPAPDRWSVAQCLDHLASTTGPLVPAVTAAVARARSSGLTSPGPFRYGFLGRFFLRSLAPTGTRPVSAPRLYRPSASDLDLAAVRERFLAAQRAFEAAVESADGLDLSRVRVSSPAMPLLRLQLGIWFLSTAAHTLRHLGQAQRVLSDPRFPD